MDDGAKADDGARAVRPGIPPGKVALLNGYDRGYPQDGLTTTIDPIARIVLGDTVPAADPKFDVQGWMTFSGGTWKVQVAGAPGDMMFPRQQPLQLIGLDPAVRYRASGAIDASGNPPVLDIQMIENPPSRRRQWIIQ